MSSTPAAAIGAANPSKVAAGPSEAQYSQQGWKNHIAVIDIGSNSVRLVVYDGLRRTPLPLFNEKVFCGLGKSVAATGSIKGESASKTISTMRRFAKLLRAMEVTQVEAVATAAVRDAKNGAAFVAELSRQCGFPVRLLSGRDEAHFSAQGVLAGNPMAEGLVGDLGGGSLELVAVGAGREKEAVTLPLGPLRLQSNASASIGAHDKVVNRCIGAQGWLKNYSGDTLYAVGGSWRALAQAHMAATGHPIRVIHEYNIPAPEALAFSRYVSRLNLSELKDLPGMSKSRAETAAIAALILNRLLRETGARRVVFSSYGLREGVLLEGLAPEVREHDPLITACEEKGARLGRFPEHADEIIQWTDPLFGDESASARRLRHCACLLSDIGWRVHPDHRADQSMAEIMNSPFVGINHRGRALLAAAIYFRYKAAPAEGAIGSYLAYVGDAAAGARILGMALRLGHTLSGGAAGILQDCRIEITDGLLTLHVPAKLADLDGDVLRKRLSQLGNALERPVELAIR